jgi:murein hydrolase activator
VVWRVARVLTVTTVILALFLSRDSGAELPSRAQLPSRLASLKSSIAEKQKELDRLRSEEKQTRSKTIEQERKLKEFREQERLQSTEVERLGADRAKAEQQYAEREMERRAALDAARRRLRVLYMAAGATGERNWSLGNFERNAVYANRIRESDDRRVADLSRITREAKDTFDRLKAIVERETDVRAEISEAREASTALLAELRDSAKNQAQRASEVASLLLRLKEELIQVTEVVTVITSEPAPSPVPSGRPTPRATVLQPPVKLRGLFAKGAELAKPVRGEVVQGYGKSRVGDLDDVVFNKGIDYRAATGGEARSMAAGKVVFAGELPAYGQVVIIDHGERSYSLYGRLAQASMKVGDLVGGGAVVGRLGEPDDRRRNFYFEVRRNGQPVNPAGLLKSAR